MNIRHNRIQASKFEQVVLRLLAHGWNLAVSWRDDRGYIWERKGHGKKIYKIIVTSESQVHKA